MNELDALLAEMNMIPEAPKESKSKKRRRRKKKK